MRWKLAPTAIFCWIAACALLNGEALLAVENQPEGWRRYRLRLEWGGRRPRTWSGLIELSKGKIERITSLGMNADEPGSAWNDGPAAGWITRRSPRRYDGCDLTILAPTTATMTVALQPSEEPPAKISLAEIDRLPQQFHIDAESQLIISRGPHDNLSVSIDRDHLIFAPSETIEAELTWERPQPAAVHRRVPLHWTLRVSRTETLIDEGYLTVPIPANRTEPIRIPFQTVLPEQEAAYTLEFSFTNHALRHTMCVVEFLVLTTSPAQSAQSESGQPVLVDEFRPDQPGFFREISRSKSQRLWESSIRRTLELFSDRDDDGMEFADTGPPIRWRAFRLKLKEIGQAHRLIAHLPPNSNQTIGLSILQPDALNRLMPIGIDTGLAIGTGAEESTESVRHEVPFWPRVTEPVLLIHDCGTGKPIEIDRIEVFLLPESRRLKVAHPTDQRWVGPYMRKPILAENFSATEAVNRAGRQSIDDWTTFHQSAIRLADYLEQSGSNSVLMGVLADGSAIFPSGRLESTPRYDTGAVALSGQDPLRKDVVELLYRVFDRRGLMLIPELQFTMPLPELERRLTAGNESHQGIELVGPDGRSYRQSRGTERGGAPIYNPLHPAVQNAIAVVVAEFVNRYRDHPSFGGVALELGRQSYLQFPGLSWGYDEETVNRFLKETGLRIPDGPESDRIGRRYRYLTGPYRTEWLRWRCDQLAQFHRRLSRIVASAAPHSRAVFSGPYLLHDAETESQWNETLRTGGRLDDLLAERGLDFDRYNDVERLVVLKPSLLKPSLEPNPSRTAQMLRQHPGIQAAFSGPDGGAVFFHQPLEIRLSEFDSLSPWEPAYTWLATHVTPVGLENQKQYAHALANDAQVIFEGGWMVPFGQEHSLLSIRSLLCELPAIRFDAIRDQRQPIMARVGRNQQQTWVYLVNDFHGETVVDLTVRPSREFVKMRRLGQGSSVKVGTAQNAQDRIRVVMKPHDIWAAVIDDPAVVIAVENVQPSRKALAELQKRIEQLDERLRNVRQPSQGERNLVSNAGFETGSRLRRSLPGWETPVKSEADWRLDKRNPRSGRSSLLLASHVEHGAGLSSSLPADTMRLLVMTLWLRSDREHSEVRLIFEAEVNGRKHTEQGDIKVGRDWQRFVFRVKDIPPEVVHPTVRIERRGQGKLWIDDVEIQTHQLAPDDFRQLSKVFSAVSLAWEEGRYADCQRLINSYWARYLLDKPAAPSSTKKPPNRLRFWSNSETSSRNDDN